MFFFLIFDVLIVVLLVILFGDGYEYYLIGEVWVDKVVIVL